MKICKVRPDYSTCSACVSTQEMFNVVDDCSVTMTKHHFIPAPVVMNEDLWNSLSSEDQEIVQKAFNDSISYQREQAASYVD